MATPFDEKLIYKKMGERIKHAIVLSLVFSVCCLPVITIGPALTGLYYAAIKDMNSKDAHVVKNFFKSFKENFKQSVLMFLIFGVVYFISTYDLVYGIYKWREQGSSQGMALIVVNAIVLIAVTMVAVFAFPLQAKFDNKISDTLRNAASLAFKNISSVVLIIIVLLLCSSVLYAVPLTIILFVLFGFGTMGYVFGSSLYKCMQKYIEMEEDEEVVNVEGIDEEPDEKTDENTEDDKENIEE